MARAIRMTESLPTFHPGRREKSALRLGYVPLADCAPIIMAEELGLYREHGLNVVLSCEIGWAAVRDKILRRELDAAHAVAGLPFAATLGIGTTPTPCVAGMVLNLQGNAITLSNELWHAGVRDAWSFKEYIRQLPRRRLMHLGVVSLVSSHHFLLRRWLLAAGIDLEREVRWVVQPPPQMPESLRAGNLDGFCAGEPWNSVAVAARSGWIAEIGAALAPRHPEKVLFIRQDAASRRGGEWVALIAALLRACAYCQAPENREHLVQVLAQRGFLQRAEERLRASYSGEIDAGHGRSFRSSPFIIFSGGDANDPSPEKGAWVLGELVAAGLVRSPVRNSATLIRSVFRQDLHAQARKLLKTTERYEKPQSEFLTVE